jgi:hypothetical protein
MDAILAPCALLQVSACYGTADVMPSGLRGGAGEAGASSRGRREGQADWRHGEADCCSGPAGRRQPSDSAAGRDNMLATTLSEFSSAVLVRLRHLK